jgi:hypothetical protein
MSETMYCEKHPKVETNLTCGKCGKPICPKCLVQTPVGIRCRECARLKSLPTYQVSTPYYLRAIGAGIGIALVTGVMWWAIDLVLPFFFLRIFIAIGAGYVIGEVIGLSVNRKRGIGLAIISGSCAVLSYAIANLILSLPGGITSIIISVVMLVAAVVMAVIRIY